MNLHFASYGSSNNMIMEDQTSGVNDNMYKSIHQITDHIYISDFNAALNPSILQKFAIDMVVNCTRDERYCVLPLEYINIPIDDPPTKDQLVYLQQYYINFVDHLYKRITSGKKVLVHCHAGQQRSPAMVVGYLMLVSKMSMNDAINHVRSKRPQAFITGINYISFLTMVNNYNISHQNKQH